MAKVGLHATRRDSALWEYRRSRALQCPSGRIPERTWNLAKEGAPLLLFAGSPTGLDWWAGDIRGLSQGTVMKDPLAFPNGGVADDVSLGTGCGMWGSRGTREKCSVAVQLGGATMIHIGSIIF